MARELLWSVGSFAGSLAVWTMMLGGHWVPALMLMVVLLIHEMGHYIAARMLGARAELPIFMVIGAFVRYENNPRTLRDDFIVSAAGPVLGTIGAALMYAFGGNNPLWLHAASLGFVLNLFQLIPVPPFDGGHMVLAIDRRIWRLGAILVIAYAAACAFTGSFMPALLVYMMWDGSKAYMQDVERRAANNPELFEVPGGEKLAYSLVYFGLTIGLLITCWVLRGIPLL